MSKQTLCPANAKCVAKLVKELGCNEDDVTNLVGKGELKRLTFGIPWLTSEESALRSAVEAFLPKEGGVQQIEEKGGTPKAEGLSRQPGSLSNPILTAYRRNLEGNAGQIEAGLTLMEEAFADGAVALLCDRLEGLGIRLEQKMQEVMALPEGDEEGAIDVDFFTVTKKSAGSLPGN